jgi:hypothetical protein
MIRRSLGIFGAGAFAGVVAALSISLGLVAAIAALAIVVLACVVSRSHAALSGGLIGIGTTWLLFALLAFGLTLNNGPGSGGGERYMPLVLVAALVAFTGIAVGVRGIARDRTRRSSLRA